MKEYTVREVASLFGKHEEVEEELVKLAYEAVTLTSPTEQMVNILAYVGIKRTLQILLIMQQSPNKVKNPEGFIRKAISKGWSPSSLPQKIDSKKFLLREVGIGRKIQTRKLRVLVG